MPVVWGNDIGDRDIWIYHTFGINRDLKTENKECCMKVMMHKCDTKALNAVTSVLLGPPDISAEVICKSKVYC